MFSVEQIFQVDVKHVSALLTYDHLWAMSDDQTVTTPQRIVKAPTSDSVLIHSNWVVEQVPFPFDAIGLLPKARQVEMLFPSLIEELPEGNSNLKLSVCVQKNYYSQSYLVIMQTYTCPDAYNGAEMERKTPNMCTIRRNVSKL